MDLDIKQIVEEYVGRIFLILSVIFAYLGLLTMSPLGTWQSAVIFLIAVAFFVTGFAFQFEWFSSDIKSKEGISMILICASIILLATAGILLLFRDLKILYVVPSESRRGGLDIIYETVYPYSGISGILGLIGIALFIIGFIVKLRSG